MKIERDGIVYYGAAAEAISNTSDSELAYYDLIQDLTSQIYSFMDKQNITKSELANILGQSRPSITQALAGETNFTIKTLAKYLTALNANIVFKITHKDELNIWTYLSSSFEEKRKPKITSWNQHVMQFQNIVRPASQADDSCINHEISTEFALAS